MHTHFTRLPHQWVAKKVPPPPLLGRWLLMLGVLLMTWGLVPQVVRANTAPEDVAKMIGIDDNNVASAFPPVDRHAYPNNMTVIASITQGGQPVSGAEIGVFADNECRGTSLEIDGLYFITISGEGYGPQLDVRVARNGQICSTNAALTYADNAMIGTLNEPFVIELPTVTGVTDAEAPQVNIMPRRVKTHVTASTNGPAMRLITIHATNGQLLYINQNPAPDTERIDMSHYAEGVYYITVQTADGKSHTAKLMK